MDTKKDSTEKDHINVIFLGHVDAGKSTIAGQTVFVTGGVDTRTVEKYERLAKEKNRGTWFLAFIMDLNEEEREKGKTVEVGRAQFETDKRRVTILDAPGHKNYVPNMIGGAAQADVGLLVISARKGEFETGFERGGQTREHAMLARTLGVSKIIVIINKMDEKTVRWSEDRYNFIVKKLKSFLKQAGYGTFISFIPVSGISGANIKERPGDDVCSWYSGKTLIETIETIEPPARNKDGPLRIPILGKYKDSGRNYLMGKIEQGTLVEGQDVLVLPSKELGKVSEIEADLCPLKKALPGENIRLVLSGANTDVIHEGFVICEPERPVKLVDKFETELIITDLLPHKPIFSAGYSGVMHVHTCVAEVTVDVLLATINKKTNEVIKKKPKFAKKGEYIRVRFSTEQSIALDTFKDLPQLGRFTLRDESKTIAMGKITRLPKSLYSV